MVSPRQRDADYSVVQSIAQHKGIKHVIVTYDIACQWGIHFQKRVKASKGHLQLPKATFTCAVGKFHLGAHVKTCFAKYSLNFLLGAGVLDGEVVETIWPPLNAIAPSTRSMGLSFRQETLDDMMQDINWKKTVAISELHLQ